MTRIRVRAAGILTKADQILLIHRTNNGKEYWVFPGGSKEENETTKETVVREMEEETSIKCEVIRLVYTHIYSDINHKQFFYECRYVSGKPILGNFNELQTMEVEDQTYRPTWLKLAKLPDILLYPLEIRDWLIEDLRTGFKDKPKVASIKSTDLRQKL